MVIEEINMYEDMPQVKANENLFALMYGDQPAGWPVIGSKATVSSFTRKDLVKYQQTQYTAKNTIVVVAGLLILCLCKKRLVSHLRQLLQIRRFPKNE